MRNVNLYYQGFNEALTKLDYLKYELNSVYGYNVDSVKDNSYNEDKIIKKVRGFTKKNK